MKGTVSSEFNKRSHHLLLPAVFVIDNKHGSSQGEGSAVLLILWNSSIQRARVWATGWREVEFKQPFPTADCLGDLHQLKFSAISAPSSLGKMLLRVVRTKCNYVYKAACCVSIEYTFYQCHSQCKPSSPKLGDFS